MDFALSLKDDLSGVAARAKRELQGLRAELQKLGSTEVTPGRSLSMAIKATAAHATARIAAEFAVQAMVKRTMGTQEAAAQAAVARAQAERKLAGALAKTLHYEARLAGHRGGRGGGGGHTTNIPGVGGGGGGGGGGRFADFLGKAAPWAVGGAVVAGTGIASIMAAKSAMGALSAGISMGVDLAGQLASAFASVARAAGQIGAQFIAATAQAFDFRTRAVMGFQAMTGNGEAGFRRMKGLALEMGTSLETTFSGVRAFTAAGFKGDDAERWFKRSQDLAGIGLDQGQIGRATLAIGQIKGAGTLQGDELRQLGELGISMESIWTEIAGKMGVSVGKAKKLKEAGKVGSDVALAGIEAAIAKMTGGGEAGALASKASKSTFAGMGERAMLGWQLFLDKVAEKTGPTFERALGSANDLMGEAFAWLDSKDGAAFVGQLAAGMSKIGEAVEAMIPLGKEFLGAFMEPLGASFKDVEKNGGTMFDWLKSDDAKAVMRDLGTAAGTLAGAILEASVWAGVLMTKLDEVTAYKIPIASLVADFWTGELFGNAAMAVVNQIKGVFAGVDWVSVGASIVQGLAWGIVGAVGGVVAAAANMALAVRGAVQSTLDIHSPSREMEHLGRMADEGFARGMTANDNSGAAAAAMASSAYEGAARAPSAPGRAPITVTINVSGSSEPQATARLLEEQLVAVLERYAVA